MSEKALKSRWESIAKSARGAKIASTTSISRHSGKAEVQISSKGVPHSKRDLF